MVFNEDRFTEELAGIFDDEDVHNLVAASFAATTVEMANLPVTPAGSAGVQQTIQQEIPPVVAALLTDEANDGLLERAVRLAHGDVLAVEGGTLVSNPPVRSVRVDLSPIFNQMVSEVAANDELGFLGSVTPPADAGVVTVLERAEPGDRFWEFLGQLQDRRSSTITLILLCGIGSLLIAPSRTSGAVEHWHRHCGHGRHLGGGDLRLPGTAGRADRQHRHRPGRPVDPRSLARRPGRPTDGHGPHRRVDDRDRRGPWLALAPLRPHPSEEKALAVPESDPVV